jgi:glycerophosphoryl diester phosphodiesterase
MKYIYFFSFFIISNFGLAQQDVLPLYNFLKVSDSKPLICGHRGGYYTDFPENSISIFDHIYKTNQEKPLMLEIDIRADKDGQLWLLHDDTLDRTTSGKGAINLMSSTEVQKLKLKDQAGKPSAENIPGFEDILNFISEKSIYLMLDIKGDQYRQVIEKINARNLADRCIILTFTAENTQKALQFDSEAIISSLVGSNDDYEKFKTYNISNDRLAAYCTDQTSDDIIRILKENGNIILSDPREVWNKITSPLSIGFYSSYAKKLNLNILVTDFPIEVDKGLRLNRNMEQTIHSIHLKKFKWFASQQFDSLTTLLHEDVHYIHSNGWKESKAEVIANIKSGKLTYTDVKVHESNVRVIDQTGVVTGKGTFYVSMDGKPYAFDLYYTEVYVVTDEGIKLISRHACKYEQK